MSYTITTSSHPSFHFNFNHRLPSKSNFVIFSSYHSSMISVFSNQESEAKPFNITSKFNAKHRVTIMAKSDFQPEAPVPAKAPSAAWKKWMVGIMLSIILPSFRHKWGPLLIIKNKVDTAVETVESLTEVVEELAKEVDKVSEEIEDKLPEDAKLRDAVESVEKLAEEAVKEADLAQEIIHKIKDAEKVLEETLMEPKKEEARKRSAQEQAPST